MAYKPYRPKLKRVSRRQQMLLDAVYSYLPATGVREGLAEGLGRAVSDELGEKITIRLESVVQETFGSFRSKLARHPILALVGLAPHEGKILCDIDSTIAMLAVERLLGGKAASLPEPREISETEQGVMQYLIVKILAEIHSACEGSDRVHFALERIALSPEDVNGLAVDGAECAVLAFRVTLGRHAGFVRLVLPDPFVEQALLEVASPEEGRPEEWRWLESGLRRYSYVRTVLWAEAGRTTLTPAELAQLEEGDVMLLEGGDLALSGGKKGRAVLRAGLGMASGLTSDVELDATRVKASVTGIHKGD